MRKEDLATIILLISAGIFLYFALREKEKPNKPYITRFIATDPHVSGGYISNFVMDIYCPAMGDGSNLEVNVFVHGREEECGIKRAYYDLAPGTSTTYSGKFYGYPCFGSPVGTKYKLVATLKQKQEEIDRKTCYVTVKE